MPFPFPPSFSVSLPFPPLSLPISFHPFSSLPSPFSLVTSPPFAFHPLLFVQLADLGSAVNSPSGVQDGSPTTNRFWTIFTPENTFGDNRLSNPTCIFACYYRQDACRYCFFTHMVWYGILEFNVPLDTV